MPTVSFTWVDTGDYTLSTASAQIGIMNWVELSYGRMTFDTAGVGLEKVDVDSFGAKVKLLDMSDTLPALAVGVNYKRTNIDDGFLDAIGADDSGWDFYLAATKVFPVAGSNLLVDVNIRGTKANQIGILGFGSDDEDSYKAEVEATVGYFLNAQTVLGAEYRMKPDNIDGLKEDDWADVFFAYFPTPNMSIVAAYAYLGDIANEANAGDAGNDQRGLYFQIQANF